MLVEQLAADGHVVGIEGLEVDLESESGRGRDHPALDLQHGIGEPGRKIAPLLSL
jgi:hypothetical protein